MKVDTSKYYGFVYETTNLINGMKYIGQCAFNRINGWKSYLGSGTYVKRAIKKYGAENFSRRILFLAHNVDELDELEIACIEAFNAVESKDYYNLKKTAKGGDTFSDNPNKEKTREIYRKIRSGKGNSQYGKPKTAKMIQSVKDANSKRVMVDGVIYNSLSECSIGLGIKLTTLCYRLNSPFQFNYSYIDDKGIPIPKEVRKKIHPQSKRVCVDGIEYDSIPECAEALGLNASTIRKRFKSINFPNYQYVNQNGVKSQTTIETTL